MKSVSAGMEEQSTRSSRKGRIAARAAVCGRDRGSPASGVASGAAAIDASPATAVLRPIIVAEMPRVSRMMLRSGMPSPMAIPTTEIEEMAAAIGSQCSLSGSWASLLCMFSEGKREAEGETVPTATPVAQIGRGVNGCRAGMIGPRRV